MLQAISVFRRRWQPYLAATAAALLAAACQWLLQPIVGSVPFFLVPVVLLIALRLGRGAATLVSVIGAVNLALLLHLFGSSWTGRTSLLAIAALYLALTTGATILGGRLRSARFWAADTERRLVLAQENTGMGVFELDYTAGTAYISAGLSRLLGKPVFDGPIPLEKWLGSLDQQHRDGSARSIQDRLAHGDLKYEREMSVLLPDGRTRWLLSRITLETSSNGALARAYGATVDITDRKLLDEKLAASQAALEEQRKLEQERLIEADRRKDDFLATLAHELRSPLAPIRQAVMILESAGADEVRRRKSLQIVERQVKRMALLLEDLLDVSRLARATIPLRRSPVSMYAVIDAAVETSKPLRDSKNQQLVIRRQEPDFGIDVDTLRISQVVANLLANAAKYSDDGALISLDVSASGPDLSIKVLDAGIGLSQEQIERVFEMFVQAPEGLARSQGGLGIGLSLARSIVRLHGGELWARSDGIGLGSTFEVFLPGVVCSLPNADPLSSASLEPQAQSRSQTPVERTAKVLIADDNPDSAESLAELVRLAGHNVFVAFDGVQAFEIFKRAKPQLVLMDVGMPRMSGLDVAQAIRSLEDGAAATLIAISGWGQGADREKALRSGFDQHITKPIEPMTLNAIIASVRNLEPSCSSSSQAGHEDPAIPGLHLA